MSVMSEIDVETMEDVLYEQMERLCQETMESAELATMFDYQLKRRFKEVPLAQVPAVQSYLRRHRIDLLVYLDKLEPTCDSVKLAQDESYQKDFLMDEIEQKITKDSLIEMLDGIAEYLEEHHTDFLTDDYLNWRYGV